ncbi:unnamed protein product [Prunus brigantina]
MAGLIERFQSMRNVIFLLICWETSMMFEIGQGLRRFEIRQVHTS